MPFMASRRSGLRRKKYWNVTKVTQKRHNFSVMTCVLSACPQMLQKNSQRRRERQATFPTKRWCGILGCKTESREPSSCLHLREPPRLSTINTIQRFRCALKYQEIINGSLFGLELGKLLTRYREREREGEREGERESMPSSWDATLWYGAVLGACVESSTPLLRGEGGS